MHEFVAQDHAALGEVTAWITARLTAPPETPQRGTHAPLPLPALDAAGIGTAAAWATLRDTVLPTAFATDHPRYLAFVGGAPSTASVLADAALSAAAVYGGSELEAGTVVAAERSALQWLSAILGYPEQAHGAFVSGGSTANLSGLVAARHGRLNTAGRPPSVLISGGSAHSSVRSAAEIMGCSIVTSGSPDTSFTAADLAPLLAAVDTSDVVAVVASAGATNTGSVDDLAGIAELCEQYGVWLHVDAAYGGPAMLTATQRPHFAGIERADSVTIDPHKWLFTPYDCAAILYRDPETARAAHRQAAPYLDIVNDHEPDNPSDYAIHLSRRARGLPLWTSLLAYGTSAYVDAVEVCLRLTSYAAKQIEANSALELVAEPKLSVVLFRRHGWSADDYSEWSRQARLNGLGLVTPTTYEGGPVLRFCFVNPRTTDMDVDLILHSLEGIS